jgi:hypothetical protein
MDRTNKKRAPNVAKTKIAKAASAHIMTRRFRSSNSFGCLVQINQFQRRYCLLAFGKLKPAVRHVEEQSTVSVGESFGGLFDAFFRIPAGFVLAHDCSPTQLPVR